jgi:hypothetical protein
LSPTAGVIFSHMAEFVLVFRVTTGNEFPLGTITLRGEMRKLAVLVTGVLLTTAGPVFAQDASRGEFSAGWRYDHATLHDSVRPVQILVPNDLAKGWYADAAVNLSPKFAIVGEAGGTYFSDDVSSTTGPVSIHESLDMKFHTFMGGVRVRAPQVPWLVPFGQVLVGGERDTSTDERSFTVFQNTSTSQQEVGSSHAALALDGGLTMSVAGGVGARASVGYVRMFSSADADAFRLSLGAVLRF